MLRRIVPFLLLVAACSSGAHEEARVPDPTVTTASTTSTTQPAPTTTTPAPLPAAPASATVAALQTPAGVIVPVTGGGPGHWQVESPCGRDVTVGNGTPIRGATVVLDPGHGGVETGASGANGLVEKDLNLKVAQLTKAALERAGATVVLTRTADYRVTLDTRAAITQRLKPPVMISIHHNGDPKAMELDKPGTETFFQHAYPASKRLAGLVYEEEVRAFAAYPGIQWWGNADAGAKFRLGDGGGDYYGILRGTNGVTAVLSEALFLSASRAEADLLARPDVQQAEADAIARAVRRFMLSDDAGSGFVTPLPRTAPAGPGGGATGCVDPPLG